MCVLRNDYDVRFHLSGYAMHCVVNSRRIKNCRGFDDGVALAVTDKYLNGNFRSELRLICQVDNCSGNPVRNFIAMCWVYFFKHRFYPFLAFNSLSMRSSCGLAPEYSVVQFSFTI